MLNISSHLLTLCLLSASQANHVPPDIAASILYVEGGKVGTISQNKNGSVDLGVMQINDKVWLSTVSKALFKGDTNKAYNALIYNPCTNIKVGVWILGLNLRRCKGDVWAAVGRYHSSNPVLAEQYISRVKRINMRFFTKNYSL